MGAAKCAMLLQLADGIEKMKQERGSGVDFDLTSFDGPIDVTPTYLDVGYRGYSWRIIVRADQELRMLRTLKNPTAEASALRLVSVLDEPRHTDFVQCRLRCLIHVSLFIEFDQPPC